MLHLVPAGAVVYFGETLNHLAAQHWQKFAGQNYFDEHGIFYSIVVSAPLLLIVFVILVSRALFS